MKRGVVMRWVVEVWTGTAWMRAKDQQPICTFEEACGACARLERTLAWQKMRVREA